MTKKGAITTIILIIFSFYGAIGQALDSSSYTLTIEEDILGMELRPEDEAIQSIYVLSKEHQDIAQSAISYTLITEDDILQSGATTLLEVLRFTPDFVVRQSTNGNYTLQLRGSSIANEGLSSRNTVLLMVNEVPYYNFMEQSVWWETLPVDIHDIEKIEIVRFPHGAWYGPEAAEGVINIVTKRDNGVGLKTHANARAGLNTNYAYQGGISFFQGGRFRARVAGFYNQFTRFQQSSYVFSQDRYVNGDSLLFFQINARTTNPSVNNAQRSSGAHLNTSYQWSKNTHLQISAGTQSSETQGIFRRIEEIASSNRLANTNWLSVQARWKPIRAYVTYQASSFSYSGYNNLQWDKNTQWLGRIEYTKKWKKYRLGASTEALHYEYANGIADTARRENSTEALLFPEQGQRYSASTSQQLSLSENRLILTLANRLDYYTNIDQLLLNHQLSALLTLFPAHKISMAVSLSERPPSIFDYNPTDTELLTLPLQPTLAYEAKYRYQITKNIQADLTYFQYSPRGETDNLLATKRSGFSGNIDWQINRLMLSGNITQMQFPELDTEISL
ncbi:MAG: TonB-dependent receptor plug domain-containing protein [Bacteroidota bacterium]